MLKILFSIFFPVLFLTDSSAQSYGGIATTCLSTHVFNACGTAGYITFGFTGSTGAGTTNPDPLTIQQTNFSVGVNTNAPQARLHIRGGGTTAASSAFLVSNNQNIESFRILDNGNIGIGISTPQTRLAVNGIISSQKVMVTPTGWPDYVFDTTYHLLPLQQLEKYILINKHLPDIASVGEVKKDGLDLGDTQAALLKKVEELTLYLIRQDKELQELKDINKKLELQNARLEQQAQEIARLKERIGK